MVWTNTKTTLFLLALALFTSNTQTQVTADPATPSTTTTSTSSTTTADTGTTSTTKDYGKTYPLNCRAGCMVCSYKDICLLCNFSNFFLQHGYTCKKKIIENCAVTNDGVNCLFCTAPYYLDTATKKCVKATTEYADCKYYGDATTCTHCEPNKYFLVKSETNSTVTPPVTTTTKACTDTLNVIEKCMWYTADSKCGWCERSNLVNFGCTTNPIFGNCLYYSDQIACVDCQEGYSYFRDKFLFDSQTNVILSSKFFLDNVTNLNNYSWFKINRDDMCLKSVEKCKTLKFFNDCLKCNDGYFRGSDGGCVINPLTQIPNCFQYSNSSQCTTCMAGYYLNSNQCLQQAVINNCKSYSITTQNVCEECITNSENFFDNGNKICKKREKSIKNCDKYTPQADTCQTCLEGYIISNGNTVCSTAISKCTSHYFLPGATGATQKTVCKICLAGFYLKTQIINNDIITSCELPSPSILGCVVYGSNSTCTECENGFYLANEKCHVHNVQITEKLKCDQYSTIRLNECSKCPTNFYLYQLYNYCENLSSAEIIKNCEIYASDKSCFWCKDKFYVRKTLNVAKNIYEYSCISKDINNCTQLDRDSATCLACNSVLYKIPNIRAELNECVDMPDYQKSQCSTYTLDTTNLSPKCQTCLYPYYPIEWSDLHYGFCVKQDQISKLYYKYEAADVLFFENCQIQDLGQAKKCRRCIQNGASNKIYIDSSSKCANACAVEEAIETFGYEAGIPAPLKYLSCKTKLLVDAVGIIDNCHRFDYEVSSTPTGTNFSDMKALCMSCGALMGVMHTTTESKFVLYDYLPQKDNADASTLLKKTSFFHPRNRISGFYNCIDFGTTITDYTYMTATIAANQSPVKNGSNVYISLTADPASYTTTTSSIRQHCAVVTEDTAKYGCGACKWGFKGVRALSGTHPFILHCEAITDCNRTTYYTGLGSNDTKMLNYHHITCHKCSTDGNIPTVTIGMIRNKTTGVDGRNYFSIDCMPRNNPTVKGGFDAGTFPENCAIQEIVEGVPQWQGYKDEFQQPNPVCVACEPGYRAVNSSSILGKNYNYIAECVKIDNCMDTIPQDQFNMCKQCKPMFVFLYASTLNTLTLFDKCVPTLDTNCLIGESSGKCFKCKPGFFLNVDNHCDQVKDTNCEEYGNLQNKIKAFDFQLDAPFGNGCLKCATDFLTIRFPYSQSTCVKSLATARNAYSLNYFIDKCAEYYHDINFGAKCRKCESGYNPTDTDKYCVKDDTIPNCKIYIGTSDFKCSICNDGFFLDGLACKPGSIDGCVEYNNQTTCIKCTTNNIPTRVLNGQNTICFKRESSLANCETIDNNEGYSGVISCTKCNSKTYPISFSLSIKTCAEFYSIANCLEYDLKESFSESSFTCSKCAADHFSKQGVFPNVCERRVKYPIANCLEYDLKNDECKVCIENFYLNSNKISCEPNPIGMVGCIEFKTVEKCNVCNELHYQSNNDCVKIPTNDLINNCEKYERLNICAQCKKGYNNINNKCSEVQIENCDTVGYDGTCETCKTGFKYFGNKCEAVSVAKCLEYSDKNTCVVCEDGNYASGGRCFEVTPITSCAKNDGNTTCSYCSKGFVLDKSVDPNTCRALTDTEKLIYKNPFCSSYVLENVCLQCNQNFYFDPEHKSCKACTTDSTTCSYCDYSTPDKCIMCLPGHYMTPEYTCRLDSEWDVATPPVEEILPDIYIVNENNMSIFSLISMIWLINLII